jgi:5-methylcytosine-specific restriction protein A
MPGDLFYSSAAWRELRRKALKRDGYRCTLCRADVRKLGASRVDHVKSRRTRPDLALVLANLRTLCVTCDNQQQIAKKERRHGPAFERVDADGLTDAWREAPDK